MKKIAIIGTQGVPAKYGGFETLVENLIGNYCSEEIRYTVFCSGKDYPTRQKNYKKATLEYIPLHANGMQSIFYDIWSLIRTIRKRFDVVLILGVSGCVFLPFYRLFYRKRLVINIDGLEHKRDKWGSAARRFLRFSEKMAVRYADVVIADNKGIQDYVTETYKKDSVLITYGGDHALIEVTPDFKQQTLQNFGVTPGNYACTICRIEPENNCHLTLEAFAKTDIPLLFIGNWENSDYGRELKRKYGSKENIHTIDPIYDRQKLFVLREQCKYYIHGHSAGGTNPSLVEALFCRIPILAFDVVYNRETTGHKARYWKNTEELHTLVKQGIGSCNADELLRMAKERYTWQKIVHEYESTYKS